MVSFHPSSLSSSQAAALTTVTESPSAAPPGVVETIFTRGQKVRVVTCDDAEGAIEFFYLTQTCRDMKKYLVGILESGTILELAWDKIASANPMDQAPTLGAASEVQFCELEKKLLSSPQQSVAATKDAIRRTGTIEHQKRNIQIHQAPAPDAATVARIKELEIVHHHPSAAAIAAMEQAAIEEHRGENIPTLSDQKIVCCCVML